MMRSFDWRLLREVAEDFNGPNFDYEGWIANHLNVMLVEGDDVGLFTLDYPGVYTGHWFFVSRGKAALDTAHKMLTEAFDNYGAQAIRGVTPLPLKAARYLAKRLGFVSVDIFEGRNGPSELMVLTKADYKKEDQS